MFDEEQVQVQERVEVYEQVQELKNIENIKQEIESLVQQFKEDSDKFKKESDRIHISAYQSESTLLDIGLKLNTISISMTEKEFIQFKLQTATKLDFEKSSLDKVIKISRNSAIMNNRDKLPDGWATLYLLCPIEPKDFAEFMSESEVDKNTTRAALREMVDKFKEARPEIYPVKNKNKKKEKLTIRQFFSTSVHTKSSEELMPLLNDFLAPNGWELVVRNTQEEDQQEKAEDKEESEVGLI